MRRASACLAAFLLAAPPAAGQEAARPASEPPCAPTTPPPPAPPPAPRALVRIATPGSAFVFRQLDKRGGRFDEGAFGRRFSADMFAILELRGELATPARVEDANMVKLVVRFRATRNGPTLRSISYGTGNFISFRKDVQLGGDQLAERPGNSMEFADLPVRVRRGDTLRLNVSFPGGFDSVVDPGSFELASVVVDYRPRP